MSARAAFASMAVLAMAVCLGTAIVYPSLPDQVPMHWNMHGEIDGWGQRSFAAWFVPGLVLLWAILTWLFPWLSPKHFRVDEFRSTYYQIMAGLAVMFGLMQAVTLRAALRPEWDSSRWFVGGLCLALALFGNVLGRVRRNFWIGVRTPWTLASEAVWDATHRLAARAMFAGGLLGAVLVVCGGPPVAAFVLVMAGLILPAAYSLVYYKRFDAAGRL